MKSIGAPANYKSTNTLQFRGQEKTPSTSLGHNPNNDIQEEYLDNLRQQVHFMELELKILKEKVIDDEQKSGIGSLFDDEKTSHQHIQLLKTKYMQMRKDYDKKQQDLAKQKLEVVGEQFVLNSQIEIITQQTNKLQITQGEFETTWKQQYMKTEKKAQETQSARTGLDQDNRNLENQNQKESNDHYEQKMIIDKTSVFDKLNFNRHDRDFKLDNDHKQMKEDELTDIKAKREKAQQDYLAMADLQALIKEANDYLAEIELNHVQLQFLSVKIKEYEDGTEFLLLQKEKLDDAKKRTDETNEELEKQLKAKEEANHKRLLAKLQRDKNPEIKDLIAKEEAQQELNEDLNNKFREEFEKHNHLLDELTALKETLKLAQEKFKETEAKISEQSDQLQKIRSEIEQKQVDVNKRLKLVEEARKVNLFEEEKNRKYAKANAALKAKLKFIEEKYDYTSSATKLSLDDFRELVQSNTSVNNTVGGFTGKLEQTKQKIQKMESLKSMMM